MAFENVSKFEKILADNAEIQGKINELAAAFKGDSGDDKALFEATIGMVAAEAGLPFSYEEALGVTPDAELSDDELDMIAGGSGVCYIIGGSTKPETGCVDTEAIGYACAYVGVTAGH